MLQEASFKCGIFSAYLLDMYHTHMVKTTKITTKVPGPKGLIRLIFIF